MTVCPWRCRLYPERGSSLYVRVQVWPTKRAFLAHVNATHHFLNGRRAGPRCNGTCSREHRTLYRHGRARRRPIVAVVNMWRGKLTMSVVTHELFHATIAWAHRIIFPFATLSDDRGVTETEERLTYAHSELCRQFMVRASSRGGPYTILDGAVTSS